MTTGKAEPTAAGLTANNKMTRIMWTNCKRQHRTLQAGAAYIEVHVQLDTLLPFQ